MGTKQNPGEFDCYANAEDDEPMFILLARDPIAADLVRLWAKSRELAIRSPRDADKAREARRCADAMEEWFGAREFGSVLESGPGDPTP